MPFLLDHFEIFICQLLFTVQAIELFQFSPFKFVRDISGIPVPQAHTTDKTALVFIEPRSDFLCYFRADPHGICKTTLLDFLEEEAPDFGAQFVGYLSSIGEGLLDLWILGFLCK
jgi:hypothetical protein